jgi:hypothetical protein
MQGEPSLRKVVLEDIRQAGVHRNLHRTLRRDLAAIYRFYLDDDERARLESMGRFRRALFLVPRVLKSMLFKLSPGRRFLLLLGLVFSAFRETGFLWGTVKISIDLTLWGFLLVLLVLMLELKDKLLAKEEIEIARQVQIALLPREHPAIPGWSVWSCSRPANDVGGDLVDYLPLPDGRIGMALGDVAGKGLGAALLMAKLQATLRALAPEGGGLDALAARINAILNRDGLENRFATLFYLEVEPGSGRARWLNAGHNPPLVARGGTIERLDASSLPLGMFPAAAYAEGALELAPGESLLVYSDGLVEATGASEEEFGMSRLEASVGRLRGEAPRAIGEALLAELDGFVGEGRPADDVSLLIVRRD